MHALHTALHARSFVRTCNACTHAHTARTAGRYYGAEANRKEMLDKLKAIYNGFRLKFSRGW
jgi:hypothetical protein